MQLKFLMSMSNRNFNIVFDDVQLIDEFLWFKNHQGKLSLKNDKNKIVKYFQQDIFYRKEKELLENKDVYAWLVKNRCKFLSKEENELTMLDLLDGFKKSGKYYGYSMFNPLLAKWFYEKYNVKSSYDPCGGWGHRLLGSTNLDLYIYNDLSIGIANNVKSMISFFDIKNSIVYNEDAKNFMPKESFDAIFTCPPYFNCEKYECESFSSKEDFDELLNSILDVFYHKKECRVCGIVMREDLFKDDKYKLAIPLTVKTSHLNPVKNNIEKMFIYEK